MSGSDMAALAERIRTLNAPDQGMNFHGGHSGERRFDEKTGEQYWTRGQPATLTVYGDRARILMAVIEQCADIAEALNSTPPADGGEV